MTVIPGGKLSVLTRKALEDVTAMQGTGRNLVYFMCGIPDITTRLKGVQYEEVVFRNSTQVYDNFHQDMLKAVASLSKHNSKVVFIPMVSMNLKAWNEHRFKVRKTKELNYKNEYFKMQGELNTLVLEINRAMIELNTVNGLLTPFCNSIVNCRTSGRVQFKFYKLVDGVHPNDQVKQEWIKLINRVISINERKEKEEEEEEKEKESTTDNWKRELEDSSDSEDEKRAWKTEKRPRMEDLL